MPTNTASPVSEALKKIKERDAEARIKAEKELLDQARSLTNGKSGCSVTQGKVMLGLTEKVIEVSSNCRQLVELAPRLQTKDECQLVHLKPIPRGFNVSTNLTILGTAIALLMFIYAMLNGGQP
jgi:hypothetical protein